MTICQRCEVEKTTDAAKTFLRVFGTIIPTLGLSTTERSVDPAKREADDELLALAKRWRAWVCTHPRAGRPQGSKTKTKDIVGRL